MMAKSIAKTQVVKFIRKGDKGEQGGTLRGPQAWSDCAVGYKFQAGAVGEIFLDVVIYNNNYYLCKKAHTKTATNYPGSTTANNNGYWQLSDKIDMVATKLLLATYALIENLGVEAVEMKNSAGQIVFQVKDGNVICKTGAFENISVSGDLLANTMRLKISTGGVPGYYVTANGAAIVGDAHHTLPMLQEGECRTIIWINPLLTKLITTSYLMGATDKVLIAPDGDVFNASQYYQTTETGCYNLVGIREDGSSATYWHIFKIPNTH